MQLTNSMNYKPVVTGNQSNGNASTKACNDAGKARIETIPGKDYILLPMWPADLLFSQDSKISPDVWNSKLSGRGASQFKLQQVWTLMDLPNGKRAIGTKWVYRNKKYERVGHEYEAIRYSYLFHHLKDFSGVSDGCQDLHFFMARWKDKQDFVYQKVSKLEYSVISKGRCLEWNEKAAKDKIGVK
ncbi:hypothetical protein Tco_0328655 [Tanacetum coccineum]